jgi:acetyl esterase
VTSFDVEVTEVPYGAPVGPSLTARVHRPVGDGPFPAVVLVHGGMWQHGDRRSDDHLAERLARRGVIGIALEFRTARQAPYPGPLSDIRFGICWAKTFAPEVGGSSEVGAIGSSSGGHQLMLVALGTEPDAPTGADASLLCVALCWPVLDPLARYQFAQREGRADLVAATEAYFGSDEAMRQGNPQLVVDEGRHTRLPPVLVVHGQEDENVPVEIPRRFAHSYRRRGGAVDLQTFPAMPHDFIRRHPASPEAEQATDMIERFIRRHHRPAASGS